MQIPWIVGIFAQECHAKSVTKNVFPRVSCHECFPEFLARVSCQECFPKSAVSGVFPTNMFLKHFWKSVNAKSVFYEECFL